MTNQNKAYIYGLAAVLLWSTVAAAFKIALRYLEPLELLLWSNLFATAFLAVIVMATRRFGEVLRSTKKQLVRSFLLGLLNPFLYYLILFKAYDLLPAQVAQPLNFTWAFTLALLSVPLLGQRFGLNDITGLLTGYAGVLVIVTGGSFAGFRVDSPFGIGLVLGSTVVWALYWIYNTRDTRHPAVCLFLSFAFSLIPLGICFLLFGEFRWPDVRGILGAAYAGLFEMSITYVLWLSAMRLAKNTATIAGLIFLAPFLSLVLIRFLVGEQILPATVAGLALIVAGLSIQKYGLKLKMAKHPKPE